MRKYRTQGKQAGLSLLGVMVSLAISGLLAAGVFSFLATSYQNQIVAQNVNNRLLQAEIMKAALDNTLANAGSNNVLPTTQQVQQKVANSFNPFDPMAWMGLFMFGNCNQGSGNGWFSWMNMMQPCFWFGGCSGPSATTSTTSTPPPALAPTTVTSSSASFGWYAYDNNSSSTVVACTGSLTIQGNALLYTESGGAACTNQNTSSASTSYPVGAGWSFSQPIANTPCLGPAFRNQQGTSIIATRTAVNGLPASTVAVCLVHP